MRQSIVTTYIGLALFGCSSTPTMFPSSNGVGPAPYDEGTPYDPSVTASDLDTEITNPLFPAPRDALWIYEGDTEDGLERIEITVLDETKSVWDVDARVIRDTVTIDEELVEDTWDWFAQDTDGNVWYLGEDTQEFEDGEVVCECGAWEAGIDEALPGVIMLAEPSVGDVYREEYYEGEAEDVAEVVAVGETVLVPAGTFEDCVKTRNVTPLERNVEEFKYYCPGVGLVLTLENGTRVELVEYDVPL